VEVTVATEAEPTLAGVFTPATEEQWLTLVDKVLKGAPRTKLHSSTPDRIDVAPLYTRANSPGAADESGFPGSAPFTRGTRATVAPWGVRALITAAGPDEANRVALRELERGATSLTVRLDAAFRHGCSPEDPAFAELSGVDGVLVTGTNDLARALDGVLFDLAAIHLQPGAAFSRAADLLTEVWERSGVAPADVCGSIGADPVGVLATTGVVESGIDAALAELGGLAARVASSHPRVRTVTVDTMPYVEAGAGETQELAAMLSTGAAYLRALSTGGLGVDDACGQIAVTRSMFTHGSRRVIIRSAVRTWSCSA
jgi:methylmalonyl-CoA mutase